ncbi:hypothetical protein NQL31_002811 [Lotmaria passim]
MRLFNPNRRSKSSRANAVATAPPRAPVSTTTTQSAATHYPEAIPCHNYYEIFPEDAGPMGHVVIDDSDDMRVWRLTAQLISPEEALKQGGCLQYVADEHEQRPQYYIFARDASAVYGTAAYQKVLPDSLVMSDYAITKPLPSAKLADVASSYGGISDEGLTDTPTLVE